MPTTTVKLIGSGGDYTTLQSWEDACPANLVSSDQIWRGEIKASTDTFSSASNLLTIAGTTVDSTRYVQLTTATGASFRDNASVQSNALRFNASNGCEIRLTGSYATAIICNQGYTRFSNLQIAGTNATSCFPISCQPDTAGTNSWDFCIFECSHIGGTGTNYGNVIHRNCLHICRASSATRIARFSSANATAVNCSFVVPSDKTAATTGIEGAYISSQVFKNCAIFGATDAATTTGRTFTTCYVDDASPPSGCTTLTYNTSAFVNITDATRDYRIPSGSGLIDVGTTDSTNAPIDIAGTSRPSGSSYDVGCWEYVSAGSSVFIPLIGRGPGLALAAGRGLAG